MYVAPTYFDLSTFMPEEIRVQLNGQSRSCPVGTTLQTLLTQLGVLRTGVPIARHGLAVELNGEVVPARVWADTRLANGDRLELVTAFPGG